MSKNIILNRSFYYFWSMWLTSLYRSSVIFCTINKIRYPHKAVSPKTDITIDGFQRSANTYCYFYFKHLNNDLQIAHHSHSYRQIIYSVKNKIPTVLLIRNPLDAISSSFIYHNQKIPIKSLAKAWINFYKPLIPLTNKMVIANFDDSVDNFSTIIKNVNELYNTKFESKLHHDSIDEIKALINNRNILEQRTSLPSKLKKQIKNDISNKLKLDIKDYIDELNNIYNIFLNEDI